MTGRCRRNLSIISLQVQGLSRSLLEKHPPPDQQEDQELTPDFEEGSRYQSVKSSPSLSNVSLKEGSHNFTRTLTGNTTDRSSVDDPFWGNDESEKKAAGKIQVLFNEINEILYEQQRPIGSSDMYHECEEWSLQFPHLRVLGQQIFPSEEQGYDAVPRLPYHATSTAHLIEDDQSFSNSFTPLDSDLQLLNITGKSAERLKSQSQTYSGSPRDTSSTQSNQIDAFEEIIEKDGNVEEIIAIDYPERIDTLPDGQRRCPKSSHCYRTGYPPITPLACVQENIASAMFDYTWNEVLVWMKNLLSMYFEYVRGVEKAILLPLPTYRAEIHNISREASSMYNYPKVSLPTRTPSFITSTASWKPQSLDGILTVKQKDIVERPGAILHDGSDISLPTPNSVGSNFPPQNFKMSRPGSVKYNRLIKPLRLAPLHNVQERSRTPCMDEEVLKVTKLMPAGSESLSSPPSLLGFRNGCLPPICSTVSLETPVGRPQRYVGGSNSNRISSAVGDKDKRSGSFLHREKSALSAEGRPNTTRSETPFSTLLMRRSSTPPWQQTLNSSRGHSLIGGQNVTLGISGNSLQPFVSGDIHSHMSLPQEDIPEADELHPEIICSSWAPATTSNKPLRRNQQYSTTVQS
ncbi:primary cilium assembly protein FAM149B1 isoform X2 [Octopus bimaculoides]|uniref:primary cilium assembly protein FAM149B1 isoform X2 n=1 Tax=Octopus bimaculoides TaxID=37653 RepID=UPI0022E6DE33|nr:primary cilium assembly protein FAM149B1 isoform X2 [Octopus bimaculoides]